MSPDSKPSEAGKAESELASAEFVPAGTNGSTKNVVQKQPLSRGLVIFLRTLIIGGGLFVVFVIGLAFSFSACFTIKGPPPPECAPVSFVTLILMPLAALLFLIPLAKKVK